MCSDPEDVPCISQAIVKINRIPYYKNPINSKAKFHGKHQHPALFTDLQQVTMGHATVMATFEFFGQPEEGEGESQPFAIDKEYKYIPSEQLFVLTVLGSYQHGKETAALEFFILKLQLFGQQDHYSLHQNLILILVSSN